MKQAHDIIISQLAGLILLLGVASAPQAEPIIRTDQQNPGPVAGTNGGVRFGQSFTPTLPALDAIEFLMAGLGQTVVVNIFDGVAGADGLGAPLLATSNPVTVFTLSGHRNVHFDFPDRVGLTPGQRYVAALSTAGGIEGVSWTTGNAYGGGQFLQEGFAAGNFSEQDLIFAEGLTRPIPLPGAAWLLALGFAGIGLAGRQGTARRG